MHVTQRYMNRVQLESDTHQAAVRLTWNEEKKNWLLTAFEKKNSASDNTTDTDETSTRGKQNDTATPLNTVSTDKDTTSSLNNNNLGEKVLSDEQFDEHIATLPTSDAINAITQRRGADEATAMLVEKLVKDGNIELFLNADFTGNEKLSKLAIALQNLFKYGEESPKDSIRFQQTDRSTNQLSDKDITSTSKTTLRHSNQGWENTYRRGVGRDATQSSTRQQGVGREVFEDARVTFEFKLADNRTADTALDTIEQATTDSAQQDSINTK